MKILITGGSGFIGRAVVSELLDAKHDVTILDTKMPDFPGRVHYFACDILQNMDDIFSKVSPEVVIHLAACTDPTAGPDHLYKVNVKVTKNVVDACENFGVRRIIFASTGMVYGKNSDLEVSEEAEVAPISLYAFTKAVGESLVRASSLEHIIFRMFNVAGPGFTHNPARYLIPVALAATIEKPLRLFTAQNDVRDYVHVVDVAKAYVRAIETVGLTETINLGTGIPTPLGKVLAMISGERDYPVPTIVDRNAPGLNKQEGVNLTADSTKARTILGWRPEKNLGDIIRDSVVWWSLHIGNKMPKGVLEYSK
jgi:UDP-glucose 4-epimerase